MKGFDDPTFAMAMRDVIKEIVAEVIEAERPRYRYATVVSIDAPNFKCMVMYGGDTDPTPVSMGTVIQPTLPGQIVRIEGLAGDRFIADVLGITAP